MHLFAPMGKTPPIHNFFGMMAGTTRLELATSAVTGRAVVGNRWTHRDTLARFCATICATRMTISACANLSHTPTPLFSHCTFDSVSFEEPDVTFYRPFIVPRFCRVTEFLRPHFRTTSGCTIRKLSSPARMPFGIRQLATRRPCP